MPDLKLKLKPAGVATWTFETTQGVVSVHLPQTHPLATTMLDLLKTAGPLLVQGELEFPAK